MTQPRVPRRTIREAARGRCAQRVCARREHHTSTSVPAAGGPSDARGPSTRRKCIQAQRVGGGARRRLDRLTSSGSRPYRSQSLPWDLCIMGCHSLLSRHCVPPAIHAEGRPSTERPPTAERTRKPGRSRAAADSRERHVRFAPSSMPTITDAKSTAGSHVYEYARGRREAQTPSTRLMLEAQVSMEPQPRKTVRGGQSAAGQRGSNKRAAKACSRARSDGGLGVGGGEGGCGG